MFTDLNLNKNLEEKKKKTSLLLELTTSPHTMGGLCLDSSFMASFKLQRAGEAAGDVQHTTLFHIPWEVEIHNTYEPSLWSSTDLSLNPRPATDQVWLSVGTKLLCVSVPSFL